MNDQLLLDASAAAILDAFPGAKIYTEKIPQGFLRPCFFIDVKCSEKALMQDRCERTLSLTIRYYPEKKQDGRGQAQEVLNELFAVMEWVELDGLPKRMEKPTGKIDDENTVEFLADYRFHVFKRHPIDKMRKLKQDIELS